MTEQRTAALSLANDVRTKRAEVRRRFKSIGREAAALEAAAILEAPPDYLSRLRVEQLLGWLPYMSDTRRRRRDQDGRLPNWWPWANEFNFSAFTMLYQLTPRQRALLVERLRLWSDREEWVRYCRRVLYA